MQRLYRKFVILVPWLERCTNATVTVTRLPEQAGFSVQADWSSGDGVGVYRKAYLPDIFKQRIGCVKDLARKFIQEVLEARGV